MIPSVRILELPEPRSVAGTGGALDEPSAARDPHIRFAGRTYRSSACYEGPRRNKGIRSVTLMKPSGQPRAEGRYETVGTTGTEARWRTGRTMIRTLEFHRPMHRDSERRGPPPGPVAGADLVARRGERAGESLTHHTSGTSGNRPARDGSDRGARGCIRARVRHRRSRRRPGGGPAGTRHRRPLRASRPPPGCAFRPPG